jgi:phosphoglycolate phosphatase
MNADLRAVGHPEPAPLDFIFDLDGTLIDSAPAIRQGLRVATEAVAPGRLQQALQVPIGPPLPRMAELILGSDGAHLGPAFVAAFQRYYDTEGVSRTQAYAGAAAALQALRRAGSRLAILTNKREQPTLQILAAQGWTDWFSAVLCVDSEGCAGLDKAQRLAACGPGWRASHCVLVGDTQEDQRAALASGIGFVAADYGYEPDRAAFAQQAAWMRLADSRQLGELLSLRAPVAPAANAT